MFADRQRLEAMEAERLAPYALRSKDSRGRVYAEDEPRYRTAFQRDRDRIVHSAAFRQLEYKTQVFVNDEGDYYRTRLTHTLEVAQIGRTIARALGANEDLVEVICLAHDLGHAPFGHAGEDALERLLKDHGGYNHNHQSYRIVTKLERRYPDFPGLNLTIDTLEGIAKHETDYNLSRVAGLDPTLRGSLEAQIANITDELAYNAHDLDDGLCAGILTPEDMEPVEIWRLLCQRLDWKGSRLDDLTRHIFIRELIGLVVDDVLATTAKNLEGVTSPQDITQRSSNVVCYSPRMEVMVKALKRFLFDNMYYSFRITRMKKRAERFIDRIFNALLEEPRQLPKDCQAMIHDGNLHRVIADYIASMTDRSALLEYRHLYDPLMRP